MCGPVLERLLELVFLARIAKIAIGGKYRKAVEDALSSLSFNQQLRQSLWMVGMPFRITLSSIFHSLLS
jgi:hypothetical protein